MPNRAGKDCNMKNMVQRIMPILLIISKDFLVKTEDVISLLNSIYVLR